MLVCVCNKLSKSAISAAIQAGAQTPAEVFKHLKVRRNCPNCQAYINRLISDSGKSATLTPAD